MLYMELCVYVFIIYCYFIIINEGCINSVTMIWSLKSNLTSESRDHFTILLYVRLSNSLLLSIISVCRVVQTRLLICFFLNVPFRWSLIPAYTLCVSLIGEWRRWVVICIRLRQHILIFFISLLVSMMYKCT